MGKRVKILLADDDQDICEHYAELLDQHGFDVRYVHSGNEALQLLDDEAFDVVVSDLMMPNGNGLKVRDYAQSKGVPVIFATGFMESYQSQLASDVMVMEKPFSIDDLINKIRLLRT